MYTRLWSGSKCVGGSFLIQGILSLKLETKYQHPKNPPDTGFVLIVVTQATKQDVIKPQSQTLLPIRKEKSFSAAKQNGTLSQWGQGRI
jgi:hypothetical protein